MKHSFFRITKYFLFLCFICFILQSSQKNFSCCTANSLLLWDSQISNPEKYSLLNKISDNYNLNESLCLMGTNDPYLDTQWPFYNQGSYKKLFDSTKIEVPSYAGIDLELSKAFSLYNSSSHHTEEVITAVIDTGVDYNHPDLKNRMWKNEKEIPGDGIDNDNNGYVDDIYGWNFYDNDANVCHYQNSPDNSSVSSLASNCDDHGTHCAGIIAAQSDNGEGIAGAASNINVRIMSLKIHGGPDGTGTVADAIQAIKYAELMGAQVCNLSWGFTTYNETLKEVMKHSSMLFVCAAGNSGSNNDVTPLYPASFGLDNIISVAFINAYGSLSPSSNYGAESVDIAAPGTDIVSTIVGSYETRNGSSMAAAYVSGLASMVYSTNNSLSPQQVKKILINSQKENNLVNGYVRYPGIISAVKMIENARALIPDTIPPSITVESKFENDMIRLFVNVSDEGGSKIRVSSYLPQKHKLSDFKKGTTGILITGSELSLAKTGTYTFYASDYAGNETCLTYKVLEDTIPPVITASYSPLINSTDLLINLTATDELSGIRQIKYLPGIHEANDFKAGSSGTELFLENGSAFFKAENSDFYTFYAVDNRGNKTVFHLEIETSPVTSISFPYDTVTIYTGKRKRLEYAYRPKITTDKFYFTSSDPRIATISQSGTIHARAKGKATITIHSFSGVTKKIKVTVK